MVDFIELSELQNIIKRRIGQIEQWVRVEIESHRESGGHHYINLIQKTDKGQIAAKASARIWRSSAHIINEFQNLTGIKLEAGITIVVLAKVEYNPQYGLSLIISDIDPNFSIGQRELEKQETINKLTESGLMERQKCLELPFLPDNIAVISSSEAAGYGDFIKHLSCNSHGYVFNCTLFNSIMQGDRSPESIIANLESIQRDNRFDLIVIMRGGGADSDMFCFDDYSLCKAISECTVPVLTAIGHERDFHIADMVSYQFFKTPTALADALIEWVEDVEAEVDDSVLRIQNAFRERINALSTGIDRTINTIAYILKSRIDLMDKDIALVEAGIKAADPRSILKQGYVLAVDKNGTILKNVHSKNAGDEFSVKFSEGLWNCRINEVKILK